MSVHYCLALVDEDFDETEIPFESECDESAVLDACCYTKRHEADLRLMYFAVDVLEVGAYDHRSGTFASSRPARLFDSRSHATFAPPVAPPCLDGDDEPCGCNACQCNRLGTTAAAAGRATAHFELPPDDVPCDGDCGRCLRGEPCESYRGRPVHARGEC